MLKLRTLHTTVSIRKPTVVPAVSFAKRLPYSFQVLRTGHIHYWRGAGAAATFAWPIAFGGNPADFGPETHRTP